MFQPLLPSPCSGVSPAACSSGARPWHGARWQPRGRDSSLAAREPWVKFEVLLSTQKALNGPQPHHTAGRGRARRVICRALPSLARTWQRRRQQLAGLVEEPRSAPGMPLMNIFHHRPWQEVGEGGRKVKLGYWADRRAPTDPTGGAVVPSSLAFPAPLHQRGPAQVELLKYLRARLAPSAPALLLWCQGTAGDTGNGGWAREKTPGASLPCSSHPFGLASFSPETRECGSSPAVPAGNSPSGEKGASKAQTEPQKPSISLCWSC